MLNNSNSGGRAGIELTETSPKISSESFMYSLNNLVKILDEIKGAERNLWAKKFIKNILYSKEEIIIRLYYKSDCGRGINVQPVSGRVAAAAELITEKKGIKNPAERGKKYELACQPEFEERRLAPRVGLEPTTPWLTARCSAIELPGNGGCYFCYAARYATLSGRLHIERDFSIRKINCKYYGKGSKCQAFTCHLSKFQQAF